MAFQEIVSVATLGALLFLALMLVYIARAIRHPFGRMPRATKLEAEPQRAGREILPLSSVGGGNCKVSVYDIEKGAWRACGGIGPDGKQIEDASGDGVNLLKGQMYMLTARPQRVAFRPERFIINKNAADWLVHDIKIGNRSQFSQAGAIPGECFSAEATDAFVSFETAQTAMDVCMLVSYRGPNESSPFVAATIGTAAI